MPTSRRRPEVSIVYRYVPQYRTEFYDRLRDNLAAMDVELKLVHGQPVGADARKGDSGRLEWAVQVRNRALDVAGKQVVWQPAWNHVRGSQLVVVEQATKLPLNYLLLAGQRLGGPRLALWGHGINLQADGRLLTRTGEAVKRGLTRAAHWFFAYTEGVAERVRRMGFPADHITVTQNAVDTESLRSWSAAVAEDEVNDLRRKLGIHSSRVGLYLGSVYPEKRPEYLLVAARRLRQILGDFELVVAGAGPDVGLVEAAAAADPWIHVVGPVFGRRKAVLGRLADVMLMPGLVGLAVLDAFALQTPMITTAVPYHSPEIEYLRHGRNGIVLPAALPAWSYAESVASLLQSPARLDELRRGCRESAGRYTVEEMAARYGEGIRAALLTPSRTR